MKNTEKSLIAEIYLKANTYYIADREGISMVGNTYRNVIRSIGDLPRKSNIGNGFFEIGRVPVEINIGQEFQGGAYNFDPTDVWNNRSIVIKRWAYGDGSFAEAENYISGKIKDFSVDGNAISFIVDLSDRRDVKKLPGVVCEDQSDLLDAEAKTTCRYFGQADYMDVTNADIFEVGEVVKITASNGYAEFARIRLKQETYSPAALVYFYFNTEGTTNWDYSYSNTMEKAFRFVPTEFVNKTLPMQIGNLNRDTEGVFAKTITPNEKIGYQSILADYVTMVSMASIGVWESGTKRFFKARESETIEGVVEGEYTITDDNKSVRFIVDSTVTLSSDITDTSDGITDIVVSDYTKLQWEDESTVTEWEDYPELLSMNIIAIGTELMMIVSKPEASIIYVERGFGGTDVQTHSAGDSIFQSAKYSAKNLLTFTELFKAKAMANQYWGYWYVNARQSASGTYPPPYGVIPAGIPTPPSAGIKEGILSNVVDDDITTSVEYGFQQEADQFKPQLSYLWSNLDLKFDQVEDDFTVYRAFAAIKYDIRLVYNTTPTGTPLTVIGLYDSSTNTNFSDKPWQDDNGTPKIRTELPLIVNYSVSGDTGVVSPGLDESYDSYSTIDREPYSAANVNNPDIFTGGISITTIKDLNRKWKITVGSFEDASVASFTSEKEIEIYELGLWLDIFVNFTKQKILSLLTGRMITSEVVDICGNDSPSRYEDLCENPVDVGALFLTQELRYETSDFTSNWETERDYTIDTGNYSGDVPIVAMSYGVDDGRKDGWEFVSEVMDHYNLQITKNIAGKIDIINMHKIYNNTPTGYEIKIEDIRFIKDSSERLLTIHQTGSDLIYNDIQIAWKRNNKSGEYQERYTLPGDTILTKSGITLDQARIDYYGDGTTGEKRLLEIESPYIYEKDVAIMLAQNKADQFAEIHFMFTFVIDYDHYTDVNSLSSQYREGETIYLTGKHKGVTLTSSRKLYIQDTTLMDSGRGIQIFAKSVEPLSEF